MPKRYGRKHHEMRLRLLPYAYGAPCVRCGKVMTKDQSLDLDHDERDVTGNTYRGFAHSACNRSTAGPRAKGYGEPVVVSPAARSATAW